MPITSVVIELNEGTSEYVLSRLARIPNISVYGMKESQIVTVIEGDSTHDVEGTVRTILDLDGVAGVYPVFSGEHE